jgi:SNF2 family DNA or RNA helicase
MEVRLQSEDRAHRIGQKDKVTYIDFVCPNTLDEKIIQVLNNKKRLADEITGDKWKQLFA